jgi:hypothetical protein
VERGDIQPGQIQNLDPGHLMSGLKSIEVQDHSRRHSSNSAILPIDAWIEKMDVDGDGVRFSSLDVTIL